MNLQGNLAKGVGRKIFKGEGQQKKRQKNSKKDQKIALLSLFQGEEAAKKKTKK